MFDGFFDAPNPVDDVEVNVSLAYVQNSGATIQSCELYLVRVANAGLTDESTNIVP